MNLGPADGPPKASIIVFYRGRFGELAGTHGVAVLQDFDGSSLGGTFSSTASSTAKLFAIHSANFWGRNCNMGWLLRYMYSTGRCCLAGVIPVIPKGRHPKGDVAKIPKGRCKEEAKESAIWHRYFLAAAAETRKNKKRELKSRLTATEEENEALDRQLADAEEKKKN